MGAMPAIDLIDETFVLADPAAVAAAVHEPQRWARWWPALALEVFMDRGEKGLRWSATGPAVGSLELWLEAWGEGVVVHHYVRLDRTEPGSATRARPLPSDAAGWHAAAAERGRYARRWKQHVWALKDELEGPRRAGEARATRVAGQGAPPGGR